MTCSLATSTMQSTMHVEGNMEKNKLTIYLQNLHSVKFLNNFGTLFKAES